MLNRRQFMHRTGSALSASMLLSGLGHSGEILAKGSSTDYKALVCIFLYGGNDANNMLIPIDGYADYQKVRSTDTGINITKDSLLPIQAASHQQQFGLHPAMSELQQLYNNGQLAVLCNTGTLLQPLTRQTYLSGAARPGNLFSHSDQQAQWQTAQASSVTVENASGWGGRMGERWLNDNGLTGGFPINIALSGTSVFSTGSTSTPLVPGATLKGFGTSKAEISRRNALNTLLADARLGSGLLGANKNNVITMQQASWMSAALDNSQLLANAMTNSITVTNEFPKTSLGNQLKTVASIIAARGALATGRQIFFCSLGGFDTHSGELAAHQNLYAQLSQAMNAFYVSMQALGVGRQVTTFTLSEFGRTFQPSAGAGSDHGWGSHHFIMGDAVAGGNLYGQYPTLALKGLNDAGSEGRWIPTTSVDEYGAKLAGWFGIQDTTSLFPNSINFDSKRSDLAFMKT